MTKASACALKFSITVRLPELRFWFYIGHFECTQKRVMSRIQNKTNKESIGDTTDSHKKNFIAGMFLKWVGGREESERKRFCSSGERRVISHLLLMPF